MFVTVEGPEGAGKTTLIQGLAQALEMMGAEVVTTREPGAGPLGKEIRRLLLEGDDVPLLTEMFLFLADRSHHVVTLIRPALEAGKIVICDRYVDSTLVYQGHAGGADLDQLRELNQIATGNLQPDVTLLLDLPAEIGLKRVREANRIDKAPLEFHQKVRQGFLNEAQREPSRWIVLDATEEAEAVLDKSVAEIWHRFRS
ncbi:MAG: dTMP kinase [Fimbriimonadaceae bacterium]|jgi:dTMP kinase|nr:dTMP kinase [Fimbriimonadaceae bacterium]